MRIVNGILALLLILFAVAQYNDPDGLFWVVVYMIGALWCGAAALRPGLLWTGLGRMLFVVTWAAALAGMVWFWPKTPHWWLQDVWWETETAREGMGMMILVICLTAAAVIAWRPKPV